MRRGGLLLLRPLFGGGLVYFFQRGAEQDASSRSRPPVNFADRHVFQGRAVDWPTGGVKQWEMDAPPSGGRGAKRGGDQGNRFPV